MSAQLHESENAKSGGFYLEDDGRRIGEITYIKRDDASLVIDHTYVDPADRGQGVARQLMQEVIDKARREAKTIVPVCSYARVVFQREPELAKELLHRPTGHDKV